MVDVEGRTYPVEVRYRPLEGEGDDAGEAVLYGRISGTIVVRLVP